MNWDKDISNSPAERKCQKGVAEKIYSEKRVTYILRKIMRDG
jgi:hypothetical protein